MKHLVHLVKVSSRIIRNNKKGSMYIESSMVLPMACFVMIVLIGISMRFHGRLAEQVLEHEEYFTQKKYTIQMEIIRNYERVF